MQRPAASASFVGPSTRSCGKNSAWCPCRATCWHWSGSFCSFTAAPPCAWSGQKQHISASQQLMEEFDPNRFHYNQKIPEINRIYHTRWTSSLQFISSREKNRTRRFKRMEVPRLAPQQANLNLLASIQGMGFDRAMLQYSKSSQLLQKSLVSGQLRPTQRHFRKPETPQSKVNFIKINKIETVKKLPPRAQTNQQARSRPMVKASPTRKQDRQKLYYPQSQEGSATNRYPSFCNYPVRPQPILKNKLQGQTSQTILPPAKDPPAQHSAKLFDLRSLKHSNSSRLVDCFSSQPKVPSHKGILQNLLKKKQHPDLTSKLIPNNNPKPRAEQLSQQNPCQQQCSESGQNILQEKSLQSKSNNEQLGQVNQQYSSFGKQNFAQQNIQPISQPQADFEQLQRQDQVQQQVEYQMDVNVQPCNDQNRLTRSLIDQPSFFQHQQPAKQQYQQQPQSDYQGVQQQQIKTLQQQQICTESKQISALPREEQKPLQQNAVRQKLQCQQSQHQQPGFKQGQQLIKSADNAQKQVCLIDNAGSNFQQPIQDKKEISVGKEDNNSHNNNQKHTEQQHVSNSQLNQSSQLRKQQHVNSIFGSPQDNPPQQTASNIKQDKQVKQTQTKQTKQQTYQIQKVSGKQQTLYIQDVQSQNKKEQSQSGKCDVRDQHEKPIENNQNNKEQQANSVAQQTKRKQQSPSKQHQQTKQIIKADQQQMPKSWVQQSPACEQSQLLTSLLQRRMPRPELTTISNSLKGELKPISEQDQVEQDGVQRALLLPFLQGYPPQLVNSPLQRLNALQPSTQGNRICDIYPKRFLFRTLSTQNLALGTKGDQSLLRACQLLLLVNPMLILRLFEDPSNNFPKNGHYAVWLYKVGRFQPVFIDDTIEVEHTGQGLIPIRVHNSQSQFWLMLLEKAVRQSCGQGFNSVPFYLELLTGGRGVQFSLAKEPARAEERLSKVNQQAYADHTFFCVQQGCESAEILKTSLSESPKTVLIRSRGQQKMVLAEQLLQIYSRLIIANLQSQYQYSYQETKIGQDEMLYFQLHIPKTTSGVVALEEMVPTTLRKRLLLYREVELSKYLLLGSVSGAKRIFFECVLKRGKYLVFATGLAAGSCRMSTRTKAAVRMQASSTLVDKEAVLQGRKQLFIGVLK